MALKLTISSVLFATLGGLGTALASPAHGPQVCTLGTAGVGQPASVICKDSRSGATTQTVPVGNAAVDHGGTGGTLSRHDDAVLVANMTSNAILLHEVNGRLAYPTTLQTGGEASLSGALSGRGAYVLTATHLLFYPHGRSAATSSANLLVGDGSAAQVTIAGGYVYVSEKTGSLEAFALQADGNLAGTGAPVSGIPAGAIVGITGLHDLVVSPVAHLAGNPGQATVPVSNGTTEVQQVATKEVAACWAAHDDDEVCITNPGSMTVSCGHFGPGGFKSYTSAAANPAGETVLDLDVRHGLVGILGVHGGVAVLMAYAQSDADSDFLTSIGEFAVGTATATGALLLPPAAW